MASENGYKRSCEATTKAGKPCTASPLNGTAYCLAHSDAKAREKVGFVARNGKQGRRRKLTSPELFERWWEKHEGSVLAAIADALTANRAIVVGTGPKARLEYAPDYELRLKAARELMDRRHGRPTQSHDVTARVEDIDAEIRGFLAGVEHGDREQSAA